MEYKAIGKGRDCGKLEMAGAGSEGGPTSEEISQKLKKRKRIRENTTEGIKLEREREKSQNHPYCGC